MPHILSQLVTEPAVQLGAAGIIGGMWLLYLKQSRKRDEQLDAAHTRIMGDKTVIDKLLQIVEQNSKAMMHFADTESRLIDLLERLKDKIPHE